MLNKFRFDSIKPDSVIAQGTCINSPHDIFMINKDIGRELLWIAVKGYADDWCIYLHWKDKGFDFVRNNGDKVTSEYNIKNLVPCVDEVFNKYRY